MVQRPIAVDLFAGAGGMTLGFEQAGFDVLAAVEIDPIHCATHEFNFPFWSTLCRSVTEIRGEEIRQKSAIGDQEIAVVFGGPPCQGFSSIGKRNIQDPRNNLIFQFVRLVRELQPQYFVMENVPGLGKGEAKQLLEGAIAQFQASGYQVRENYQVLNASCYGVPQNRSRLFLLGSQLGLPLPTYPTPQIQPPPTVAEALADLPQIEDYPELEEGDTAIAKFDTPSTYAAKLRNVTENFAYPRPHNPHLLTSSLRTKHSPQARERFAQTKPGTRDKTSRFLRLHPLGICNTLRAGTPRNRGAFTSPRPIHPHLPRCITVREAARLHSYPDWFRFHPTKWHGFRQIGNSVPPLLAEAIATGIIKLIGVGPEKPALEQQLGEEYLLRFTMSQAAKYYGVNPHVIEPRKSTTRKK